ncbi:phosphatidylinositol N-acetylglucosaminyltransferase [Fragilaria crotonensis]|nr:phosphatidylinositol N-acetylglucosaminyltransferase [Fragilaria crotonensis]
MKRDYPPLWRRRDYKEDASDDHESITYASLLKQFSSKPEPKRWTTICKNSFVVGQEFALACYVLARHRREKYNEQFQQLSDDWCHLAWSLATILASLLIVVALKKFQPTRRKSIRWLFHPINLTARLTLLAATLKILTNSLLSASIHTLAVAGFAIHLLGCDYTFANGMTVRSAESSSSSSSKLSPPPTMSSAAFFSTILLASQLQSHWNTLVFISASVIVFSLHPTIQYDVHTKTPQMAPYFVLVSISFIAMGTWRLLESQREQLAYTGMLITICLVAPSWKCYLQHYKVHIAGPWDIAHITIDA